MNISTTISPPAWTWAVPLIAAITALSGVMLTIILQWRNFNKQLKSAHVLKIAEMRQAWINTLRDAMSKFQSYAVTPDLDHTAEREFYEHGTKIELLMNPKKTQITWSFKIAYMNSFKRIASSQNTRRIQNLL